MDARSCFVGVAVSAGRLHLYSRPGGVAEQFPNDPDGIAGLVDRVTHLAPERVALKTTAGYETAAAALLVAGLPVAVVTPRQVLHFARAGGRLLTGEAGEAELLADLAGQVSPAPGPLSEPGLRRLSRLLAHHRELLVLRVAASNRLNEVTGRAARHDLEAHLYWLDRRLKRVGRKLAAAIKAGPAWRGNDPRLPAVPNLSQRLFRVVRGLLLATLAAVLIAFAPAAPEAPPPEAAEPGRALPAGVTARFGTAFYVPGGHAPVFSHDGRRLAVLGHEDVHVFDIATRSELFSARINPTNWLRSPDMGVRFTASGDIVGFWCGIHDKPALVSRVKPDGTASNYPLAEGKPRRLSEDSAYYEKSAEAFSISGDGTRLAVNWSGIIRVYDTASGKEITTPNPKPGWRTARGYSHVALSRDGRLIAVALGARIGVFSVASEDGVDSWEFPATASGWPPLLAFNRDGTRLLVYKFSGTLSSPGTAHIRELSTKTTENIPNEVGSPLGSAAFSPSGDRVAVVPVWESEGPVVVWDATTKKVVHRLADSARGIGAAFSPDGKTLAVAGRKGVVGLWDVESGKLAPASADPPSAIRQLRYLNNGRRLAAFPGRWIAWDVRSGSRLDRLDGAGRLAELSPDGRLAARLEGGQLAVLDAETGKERWSNRLEGADRFTRVRFSPEGSRLVTRTRETVRVWDVASGRELAAFPVPAGQYLLAVSSEARQVAIGHLHPKSYGHTADGEETVTVPAAYDTATGKKLWNSDLLVFERAPAMFSPDARFLAYYETPLTEVGLDGPKRPAARDTAAGLVVRDAATGKRLWKTDGKLFTSSLAFSPDARLLALGHSNGQIWLCEAGTGKVLGKVAHKAEITALAFSPDGKTLAAASPDAPVYLWNVSGLR